MIDGRNSRVMIPDKNNIEARIIPTVLYGIKVASNKGKNPTAITIIFLVIALEGSPNIISEVSFQLPVSCNECRALTKKCMAKSIAKPNAKDERTATGIS